MKKINKSFGEAFSKASFLKNKYVKLFLYLFLPVLINLALIRDLFEIKANIGLFAALLFRYVREHNIDYLFIVIPIVVMDLLILRCLGVNIWGFIKK
ncbi:MAG: hypothetical protein MUF15_01875 [Acidobacteria bacterium]|nr:hypothetical protein [Acidobacteriota bacterium]